MKKLIFITLVFSCSFGYAQDKDTALFICTYINITGNTSEIFKLQVGSNQYHYYSESKRIGDSLMREDMKKGAFVQERYTNPGKYGTNTTYIDIIGDVHSNKFIVQEELLSRRYKYTDSFPVHKWLLTTDTATISTILCQKATSTFRGRKYTVWFAMDIASPCGPWKFYGLPGLILYAEDDTKKFIFRLTSMEYGNKLPFSTMPAKNAIATSLKTFTNLKQQFNDDPIAALENMTGAKVTFANPEKMAEKLRAEQAAYNPIELTTDD
jgi:GLPGLI family protein